MHELAPDGNYTGSGRELPEVGSVEKIFELPTEDYELVNK